MSQLLFGSGRIFGPVDALAALGRPDGPWIVIDGYHAFMALHRPFGEAAAGSAFYLGGGYKYVMSGEGCAFLHAPAGFARPGVHNKRVVRVELRGKLDGAVSISVMYRLDGETEWRYA